MQLLGNGPHRVVEARRVASWRIERILGLRLVEGRARITRLAGLVSQRDNRREILIALEALDRRLLAVSSCLLAVNHHPPAILD